MSFPTKIVSALLDGLDDQDMQRMVSELTKTWSVEDDPSRSRVAVFSRGGVFMTDYWKGANFGRMFADSMDRSEQQFRDENDFVDFLNWLEKHGLGYDDASQYEKSNKVRDWMYTATRCYYDRWRNSQSKRRRAIR